MAAVVVFTAIYARAACPDGAPGSMNLGLSPFNAPTNVNGIPCTSSACANGPFTLTLEPFPIGLFPPANYDPGYVISPCDTVTWDFGDGTTQTLIGTDRVTHDYAVPGNYTPRATVTNALGSATVVKGYCCSGPGWQPPAEASDSNGAVIATSPSALHFATGDGKSAGVDCSDCIVVREDNGPLTLTVVRTLDLSRSVSTEAIVSVDAPERRSACRCCSHLVKPRKASQYQSSTIRFGPERITDGVSASSKRQEER